MSFVRLVPTSRQRGSNVAAPSRPHALFRNHGRVGDTARSEGKIEGRGTQRGEMVSARGLKAARGQPAAVLRKVEAPRRHVFLRVLDAPRLAALYMH